MAGSVKLNGFIENDPTTDPDDDRISIYWGGTQAVSYTHLDVYKRQL